MSRPFSWPGTLRGLRSARSFRVKWGYKIRIFLLVHFFYFNYCELSRSQTNESLRLTETNTYVVDLPAVLRLAGARNLDIQIARERLREAEANHRSALEQFFPWISPAAGFRRHEGRIQAVDGTMLDTDKRSYNVGGTITAQVELGEAIYKRLASKQLVAAATHALDTQNRDSILAAAQGYFELTKARATADVLGEAVRISSDYQKQLHTAVQAGIAFKGDELRVQVQTERFQVTVRQTLEQQRIAAGRLAQTLRLDPSIDLVPSTTELLPLALFATNTTLDFLVQQALNSRPELKQTQALVSAARENQNAALYGPWVPSFSAQILGGGLGGGKNESTGNFGHSEDYFVGLGWRVGPGGLFDFGRIDASKARLHVARLGGEKLRDQITREVVEAQTRVQSLADQIGAAKQNLATATETQSLMKERKQFGVGAVLEDIQAQQELARARSDYLSFIADYNKAQYALGWAIGELPSR